VAVSSAGAAGKALEGLLESHGGKWFSACLRITRDRAAAEDAVQEALAKAWAERARFRGDAELATWVHRIALNCAIDLVRRRVGTDEAALDTLHAPGNPAEADAVFSQALRGALGGLTELERVCFVLKHLEEWTLEEIASELGSSINSVKQALFRGVRKLRVTLSEARPR
jgi:RNA polymerase sigma-70 factor (ECF subfamily)